MFGKFIRWMTGNNHSGAEVMILRREDMIANRAYIVKTDTGFALQDKLGLRFGTYTRRRDAVRGAHRRGMVIA